MIEKSYFIAPDNKNKNDKAYFLLVKVLTETKKIAVGKIVLRDKEHVVALRPYQRVIVMHLLHYLDNIRPVDEISELRDLQRAAVDSKEVSLGKLLVENLSSNNFDLSKYSDAYAKESEKLIESKVNGRMVVAEPQKIKEEETTDLVAALKQAINGSSIRSNLIHTPPDYNRKNRDILYVSRIVL
jgi:DNA end-binding protein Ku